MPPGPSPRTPRERLGAGFLILGLVLLIAVIVGNTVIGGYWTAVVGPIAMMCSGASLLVDPIIQRRRQGRSFRA
jgi:hypothetical protein